MHKHPEMIRLTEDMLLDLMRGNDIHLIVNGHDPFKEKHFLFKGPFDGVFLTHHQIADIQAQAQFNILGFLDRMMKDKKYNIKSEKG